MSLITFAMKNTLTDVLGHDGGNEMSSSRNRPNERTLTEDEMRTQKPSRRSELVVSWCWECSRQSGSTPNHAGRYTWDAAAPLVRALAHTPSPESPTRSAAASDATAIACRCFADGDVECPQLKNACWFQSGGDFASVERG